MNHTRCLGLLATVTGTYVVGPCVLDLTNSAFEKKPAGGSTLMQLVASITVSSALSYRFGDAEHTVRVGERHVGTRSSPVAIAARRWKADGGGPLSRRWRITSAHASALSSEVSTSRS